MNNLEGANLKKLRVLLLLFTLCILNLACSHSEKAKEAEKHYQMTGVVLGLDAKLQTANIQHGPIQGWMEAMTMDYPVRSKTEFQRLHVGDHITATVNVRGTDYDLTGVQTKQTHP